MPSVDSFAFDIYESALFNDLSNSMGNLSSIQYMGLQPDILHLVIWNTSVSETLELAPKSPTVFNCK